MSLKQMTSNQTSLGRPSRLRDILRRGVGERAMAATEFALILPVALILFTGSYIYGTANEINRKVTLTTRDVTDLVTQCSALSAADMTTLLDSAAQVISPFTTATMTLIVSEVTTNAAGAGTITWSSALTGSGYTVGSPVTLPGSVAQPNVSVIWGHAIYVYTPTIGYQVSGSFSLSDDIYLMPRLSTTIQVNQASSTCAS
jgi:Flp pilus assembly protein TadG